MPGLNTFRSCRQIGDRPTADALKRHLKHGMEFTINDDYAVARAFHLFTGLDLPRALHRFAVGYQLNTNPIAKD
jgi:hypothetical protein